MKIKDIEGWLGKEEKRKRGKEEKKLESVGHKIDLTLLKLDELKADRERLKKTILMLARTISKIKTNQNL